MTTGLIVLICAGIFIPLGVFLTCLVQSGGIKAKEVELADIERRFANVCEKYAEASEIVKSQKLQIMHWKDQHMHLNTAFNSYKERHNVQFAEGQFSISKDMWNETPSDRKKDLVAYECDRMFARLGKEIVMAAGLIVPRVERNQDINMLFMVPVAPAFVRAEALVEPEGAYVMRKDCLNAEKIIQIIERSINKNAKEKTQN